MKKLLSLFCFIVCMQTSFALNNIGGMLQNITAEKDDNARIELIIIFFSNTSEINPLLDMQNSQKLLQFSQQNKDRITEAMALSNIGYDYRAFGNTAKSLDYDLKATTMAQETGNEKLIAITKNTLAHNYKDLADYPKALRLYSTAGEAGLKIKDYKIQASAFQNLSEVYISMNEIDSALMCAQKDYEISMRIHYYDYIGYTFLNLAAIHGKLNNTALAISYYDMAIKDGLKTKSPKILNWAYTSKAQYFLNNKQIDSSISTARKAIAVVQNTAFINYSLAPAKLLLDIFRKSNIDSAFKYSEMYRIANDSLFSAKAIQQTQLMTFENEVHEQELASEKIKSEDQRKQNIQFALIALGIITFIIFYLLLSRSFITNTKLIEFFGVIALLIVFEFLNLLLHPFLENMTNHTPVFMLLTMVCIAALLVPLHHRVERWATKILVEKNKKIRLATAKRTIEKLEGNN